MGDFDGLVRDEDTSSNNTSKPKTPHKSESSSDSKNNVSLSDALGGEDVASLTRKFNLDPELGEQVLVPLLNFLDKYGVGDAVNESPTVSGLMTVAEFLNDISPVISNATSYFGGRQKTLSDDDKAFLDRIREAQDSSADMTLFQDSEMSIGESVSEPEPVPVDNTPPPTDPFIDGGITDWYEMLGEQRKDTSKSIYNQSLLQDIMPKTEFGVAGIEQLAKEAGLSIDEVVSKDSQNKFNNANPEVGMDYTAEDFGDNLDLGVSKIEASMKQEKDKYERTSQARFEDLPVPEAASEYNPLEVAGVNLPTLTGSGLESVDELASKAGISSDELKNRNALGGKSPKAPVEGQEEPATIPEHIVLPDEPGKPPASTYLVDFSDFEVIDDE
tara:strand:- start:311 stop:1471 length:1161 start_codon:yes stop_codon:yes gene_type:complete